MKYYRFLYLLIFFASHSLFAELPSGYIVGSRGDRYGANSVVWAAAMLLAEAQQVPLYHRCTCHRKRENGQIIKGKIFHQILVDFCEKKRRRLKLKVLDVQPVKGRPYVPISKICMDYIGYNIPTGLKLYGLADKWFGYFDSFAKKNNWKLR